MELFFQLLPCSDGSRCQRGVPAERWSGEGQSEKPNFHMFGCSCDAKLSRELADVLHLASAVVATELGELWHLELGWRRQLVVDFRIWLRIHDGTPFRGDPKLIPQDLSQLILEASRPCAKGLTGLVVRNRPCCVLALPSQ